MAAFFGYISIPYPSPASSVLTYHRHEPPFQPPPYRGLSLLMVSPQIVNKLQQQPKRNNRGRRRPQPLTSANQTPNVTVDYAPIPDLADTRARSETMSTSSDSRYSSANTEITTPSSSPSSDAAMTPATPKTPAVDVQMHPCESKRTGTGMSPPDSASPTSMDAPKTWVPLYGGPPVYAEPDADAAADADTEDMDQSIPELTSDSSESLDDESEQGPSCILLNALHVQDIFDLPGTGGSGRRYAGQPRFRPAKLPAQINLRNLNIQQIKYSTISDIILYAKDGVTDGLLRVAEMVAQAQEDLYQFRLHDYYRHLGTMGNQEGVEVPVRYGVWCIVGM